MLAQRRAHGVSCCSALRCVVEATPTAAAHRDLRWNPSRERSLASGSWQRARSCPVRAGARVKYLGAQCVTEARRAMTRRRRSAT